MPNNNHNSSFNKNRSKEAIEGNRELNPLNQENILFKKLTKIFSGPIATKRQQNQSRLKRNQLNVYASRFKSLSGQSFKKEGYNPFNSYWTQRQQNQQRGERYREFDQMIFMPELASALDMYADEMTTSTYLTPALQIKCTNEEIKFVLEDLYFNRMNIDHNLFYWCRNMCKYGDFFMYCDFDPQDGLTGVYGLPSEEIERLEGLDESNPNYVQFQWNAGGTTYESWQVMHFRILGEDKYAPYGTSIFEPARRVWRQLTMLEDAVMSYRIVRSPERRVIYIDVGHIQPEEVEQYMERITTEFKKNKIIDEDSGRADIRYNALSAEEDYYIPVRGGEGSTRIETLPGGQYTGDIDDIKYWQNKMFASIKVPRPYLISDENSSDDKESLTQKDIHFARTIQRLQKPVVSELERAGQVHLMLLGFTEQDAMSFTLTLNNPSKIADLQELDVMKTKVDAALALTESFFSDRYVYEHVFGFTYDDMIRLRRERIQDAKHKAELAAVEEGKTIEGLADLGNELGDSGADLDGGLDALGGDDEDSPFGDLDLGGDSGGDTDTSGEDAAADDNGLLAAPGNRSDGHLTPGSKHKRYKPVSFDKRNIGARKRSHQGSYSKEKGTSTNRNVRIGAQSLIKEIKEKLEEQKLQEIFEIGEIKEDET